MNNRATSTCRKACSDSGIVAQSYKSRRQEIFESFARGIRSERNFEEMEMLTANQPLAIDQCTCSAMRKASRQITRFYDAYLEPSGLRITQFLILAALNEAGGANINTLAERLDIERTAMGKMVGLLERDGFLQVTQSPTDGRARIIQLTPEGRRLHKEAEPLWHRAQSDFVTRNGGLNIENLRRELDAIDVGAPIDGSLTD
ncbi:MarR family transcriptional regulator [Rhizobium calliandrae]|uniref:MarR family transcriptional regulator n=1 Tax=Rhizobium calliandrae TaxID=1312182 RepID=A0ABT7KDZ7_9HYPH|nr:MarR family transcriptional regulator [Rhizobium calliandrae]MDL2406843.1 MarR family transcriptional regulator [Rhizobium calliandrae]